MTSMLWCVINNNCTFSLWYLEGWYLKVPHIKQYSFNTFPTLFTFQLLLTQTNDTSKEIFWDQKIYFEISVVWSELWDIESWLCMKFSFRLLRRQKRRLRQVVWAIDPLPNTPLSCSSLLRICQILILCTSILLPGLWTSTSCLFMTGKLSSSSIVHCCQQSAFSVPLIPIYTQRTFGVKMTSDQRRCDVMTSHRR